MAAETIKVLGQVNPGATTATDLYTAPAATSAVASSLTVCNQAAVAATFRVAVRPAGAALDPKHYLHYDAPLGANATLIATVGLTLAPTDVVTVYASSATVSFGLYGSELT
jgi:hypothetical protein